MINDQVAGLIDKQFPGAVLKPETGTTEDVPGENYIPLTPDHWGEIAAWLRDNPDLKFDSLQCITGVDLGTEDNLEVRYNLHSMQHRQHIEIRIQVERENPQVPSIEQIWRIGDWFEREVYDMYGIVFDGHRDPRRMLLPEDWIGFPLRKDYETPDTYHGIVIPKVKEGWE